MKWWASLLACAWGLVSKARSSKVGLSLRGASKSFEGGFTNNALGQECGSDTRLKFLLASFHLSFICFCIFLCLPRGWPTAQLEHADAVPQVFRYSHLSRNGLFDEK